MGDLLVNFISSFWSFESKFFKTFGYLLFRPGRIAQEYNQGKRESFYHPARMYVFITFLFFLMNAVLPNVEEREDTIQVDPSDSTSTGGIRMNLAKSSYPTREAYDSAQALLPGPERNGWLLRKLTYRSIDLNNQYSGDDRSFNTDVAGIFEANLPKVFFVMIPVLALLLKLFYGKKKLFYSEHLVVAVYYNNFVFTVGCLALLIPLIPGMGWTQIVFEIWIAAYLLLALKRMYSQKWGLTIIKYLGISVMFFICLGIGLLVNFFISLLLI